MKTNKNKLAGTLLALGALAIPAQATVTAVGTDITTGANWRTAAALETDNEYGTDGYVIYGIDAADGAVAVGSRPAGASAYGCLDMAGNVYERVNVPGRRTRSGEPYPAMIKGGSWLTPHPLNLRVLDLCMQPLEVAENSVGFRVVAADPEPDRPAKTAADAPVLRIAKSWEAAVEEARSR